MGTPRGQTSGRLALVTLWLLSKHRSAKAGKRLSGHTGKVATTDGPFAEAKEVIGGYIVFEAPDMDGAVALASKFMQMHIKYGLPDTTFEIREIAGGANY